MLVGYILLTIFGALTIWFIYNKVIELNKPEENERSNQKLALISEAATRLYTTEGISKNVIQNNDTSALKNFRLSIDTISMVLDSLKVIYNEKNTRNELDSISSLLRLKEQNLAELLDFRDKNASNNYYDRVLKRLEQADYLFGSTDYEEMAKDLKPYQKKVLVDFLEYAEEDNADRLTNRTADELITTTKQVLLSLELQEHEYQKNITQKENKLLNNDLKISDRLRKIRAKIEREEIESSLRRIEDSQNTVDQTYVIMTVFGIACLITILIFGFMIIKDNNKSKLYRRELEEAKSYAEQLLQSREQIMATVTHDLRSPLNSILGYADLMGKTTLDPKQKNYVRQLKKSSTYTTKLVNDLLDLSRLESHKIRIEKLPFDPSNLIRDVVSTTIPTPDLKKIAIKTVINKELESTFISDPFRIQQILSNLVGNAYKFTKKGFLLIEADLKEHRNTFCLHVKVEDSGIGISEDRQKVIFEEFSQAEESIQKQFGGFGLGLTISRKLTDLLGGEITLKSELGVGTQFDVYIPVEQADRDKMRSANEDIRIKDSQNKHLLVVDDEASQLGLLREILVATGFKVVLAKNGLEALIELEAREFDAVFTDLQMPEMDGFELIKKIRKFKSKEELPVIALSGLTDKSVAEYQRLGFTSYLLKPYNSNRLIQVLAESLDLEMEISTRSVINKEHNKTNLYDLTELEVFTAGDDEAMAGILESLIESTQENINRLLQSKRKEDWETTAFVAHKMLPMWRQIKAHSVIDLLEKLESYQTMKLSDKEIIAIVNKVEVNLKKLLHALPHSD